MFFSTKTSLEMRCSILDKTLADILDYLLKTVNGSLSALGACLKAKTFEWLLARGRLSKNEKKYRKYQSSKLFTSIAKFLSKFWPKLITKILLFKISAQFDWACKRTWALILDWIGLECFISCWENRRKKNQINECIIQVLAHFNRYV